MDTIFMNSENSKTSEYHVFLLNWRKKNGEYVPHLEVVELVLIHCNIVDNSYQQNSRILYTFVPSKLFDSLLEISPPNPIFSKTFNSEF